LVERKDIIKQFSAENANNSLTYTILPWAVITGFLGFDISVLEELLKVGRCKNSVVVMDQIFRSYVIGCGISDLLCYPSRGGLEVTAKCSIFLRSWLIITKKSIAKIPFLWL